VDGEANSLAHDWATAAGLQNSSLLWNAVDCGFPGKGFVPLWQCLGEHRCTIWLWLCRAVLPAANKKAEAACDTEALLRDGKQSLDSLEPSRSNDDPAQSRDGAWGPALRVISTMRRCPRSGRRAPTRSGTGRPLRRIAAQAFRYCFADFLRIMITMTMMIIPITLNHSSRLVPVPPVSGAAG